MTGEELFDGTTRTVATELDADAFGDGEHTVRSVPVEEAPEAAPAPPAAAAAVAGPTQGAAEDDEYSVRIQREPEVTEETPLPMDGPTHPHAALMPLRASDIDDWTEHKVLPGETRRQMAAHTRRPDQAGAIETAPTAPVTLPGPAPDAMEVTAPALRVPPAARTPAAGTPSPRTPAAGTPSPKTPAAGTPSPKTPAAGTAAPTADPALAWMDADMPTRACLELPDVPQRGVVYVPPEHAARPDEATRSWDPAIALQRMPEWTLDLRALWRELRARAGHAWATRRRLCILGVATSLALAFAVGAALWPTNPRPLAPLTRKAPRKPPSLHPAPAAEAAAADQDIDLLVARAVVAYDTGRRVEAAELFHTLSELKPDEPAWQFMGDILDRANQGGTP